MTSESELNLQAYLDGELSGRQERQVAEWIAGDTEAQKLVAELKMTKIALAGGELEARLPETHEFYWSKIQRGIEKTVPVESRPVTDWIAAWRRLLAPLAGVALVAFLTFYSFKMYESGDDSRHHLAVVENLSEHTGAYSFRSQSEKMFVVWVYNRSEEPDTEAEETLDQ
jgi:hypothetical protein